MTRLPVALAAGALLATAAAEAQSLPQWLPVQTKPAPVALNDAQKELVKRGVQANLWDPASAGFDDVYLAAKGEDGVIVVCGKLFANVPTGARFASFIGELTSTEFKLRHWASTPMENIVIEVHCHNLDRTPAENFRDNGALIEKMNRGE